MTFLVCTFAAWGVLQVGFEVAQSRGEIAEVIGQQAAIASLGQRRWVEGEQQLGRVPSLRKRPEPPVNPFQVDQYPHQNLLLGRRREQAGVERSILPQMPAQEPSAIGLGQ